jgi:hypothetical protein
VLYLVDEFRIDLPIRPLLPGDMLGPDRMPDIHMLDFSPAIDQDGFRLALQKFMGGTGIEVVHGYI